LGFSEELNYNLCDLVPWRLNYYYRPNWSPNGEEISYYSDENGNNDVFLIDKYGNNKRQLTDLCGDDTWLGSAGAYGMCNVLDKVAVRNDIGRDCTLSPPRIAVAR